MSVKTEGTQVQVWGYSFHVINGQRDPDTSLGYSLYVRNDQGDPDTNHGYSFYVRLIIDIQIQVFFDFLLEMFK